MEPSGNSGGGDPINSVPVLQVDPLPHAGISEVLGLLEVLDDRKGREKIYTLARDLNFDFGNLLLIIKAAEMLDFVYTPGAEAVLKALGKKMIETEMNAKKKLLLAQLRKLGLFKVVKAKLQENSESRVSQNEIIELIQTHLPKEKPDLVFETLINWGRFAEFLGYSQDDGHLYLDQG